jgi:predicted transcriptional regulator
MTAEERERIQHFLARYNRIDAYLRQKLRIPRQKGGFTQVTEKFDREFPNTIDVETLRIVAAMRNALVHETLNRSDYCLIPSRTILRQLDDLSDRLFSPQRVLPAFSRQVETVSPKDSLLNVLQRIAVRDYSQFPVYTGNRFEGLLTENGITRWLAIRAVKDVPLRKFRGVYVRHLLSQEETEETCVFVSPSEEVCAVRNMFANLPLLEAVLITDNGRSNMPLKGIATRWDVLR